ncbi:MAG: hypothetical protein ABW036_02695 [Flavitalea sp.]
MLKTAAIGVATLIASTASAQTLSDNYGKFTSFAHTENIFTPVIQHRYVPKALDVTEQTIRIGGGKKEELMFGFAAGDRIIFNFQEMNNKELKEIEITEYPTLSRFSDYKTKAVKNKEIIVSQQGIYIFRLKNSSISKRICKVKIQRIPASESSVNFNSAVSWLTRQDTVWQSYTTDVVVGYDTTYVPRVKRVMVRSEVDEQLISDQVQRISSSSRGENRASIVVSLPPDMRTPYKTSTIIAWAYWVGVGPDASRAWQQNMRNVRERNLDYYTPLGAYATGGIPTLDLPRNGQRINYFITDLENRDLFMQNQPFRYVSDGKGFGDYRKFTNTAQCQGSFYLCFDNANSPGSGNLVGATNINVKVVALIERAYFEDQAYDEQVITPITEKQIRQQPYIRNTTYPVTGM